MMIIKSAVDCDCFDTVINQFITYVYILFSMLFRAVTQPYRMRLTLTVQSCLVSTLPSLHSRYRALQRILP